MVSRRADKAECRRIFLLEHTSHRIGEASRGKFGDIIRLRTYQRVRFDMPSSGDGEFLERLEVFGKMDPLQLFVRRLTWCAAATFPCEPTVLDEFFDTGQTNRTFRMSPCLMGLKEGIRVK
jgi:hypothetical protein